MIIHILGPEGELCQETERRVQKAIAYADSHVVCQRVTDPEALARMGASAPALVIDGQMKCSGRVPSLCELTSWLEGEEISEDVLAGRCFCGGDC